MIMRMGKIRFSFCLGYEVKFSFEMIEKEKLERLVGLLEEAITLVEHFTAEFIHHYQSVEEFQEELKLAVINISENNYNELNGLYNSFHPDSEWYVLSGSEGRRIGFDIFLTISSFIQLFISKDIIELIKDFQETADKAVTLFQEKYGITNLLEGWHSGLYEQTGKLREIGIRFYAFHGCGLSVFFKNKHVEFDFAFIPEQRHDCFDLWRLQMFAQNHPFTYNNFLYGNTLENDFKDLIEKKIIVVPKQGNSPEQYFFATDLK
jgi:hypothetical protein